MLYLASKSPRRRELLAQAGVEFCFLKTFCEVEELASNDCFFSELALRNAVKKAEANSDNLLGNNDYILSSDTVIEFNERILGKPKDLVHAKEMLLMMSGNCHSVATAVCLLGKNSKIKVVFLDVALVKFRAVSGAFIDEYLQNVHVIDKAGSYALQHHLTEQLVQEVQGDSSTVIGLPMKKLLRALENLKLY